MQTRAFKEEYKGHPVISIWNVDDAGNKVGKVPVISFGQTKAIAILNHVADIEDAFGTEKKEAV